MSNYTPATVSPFFIRPYFPYKILKTK